MKKWRVVVTI